MAPSSSRLIDYARREIHPMLASEAQTRITPGFIWLDDSYLHALAVF